MAKNRSKKKISIFSSPCSAPAPPYTQAKSLTKQPVKYESRYNASYHCIPSQVHVKPSYQSPFIKILSSSPALSPSRISWQKKYNRTSGLDETHGSSERDIKIWAQCQHLAWNSYAKPIFGQWACFFLSKGKQAETIFSFLPLATASLVLCKTDACHTPPEILFMSNCKKLLESHFIRVTSGKEVRNADSGNNENCAL